jgi:hypothetical protein
MNEEDALLDYLIKESLTSKNLYTLEDSVLAISNTIYNSTNV